MSDDDFAGFTASAKLAAIVREIKQRRHVYPRLVEAGRMTDGFAASQIAIMEAIAEDYRILAEKERLL